MATTAGTTPGGKAAPSRQLCVVDVQRHFYRADPSDLAPPELESEASRSNPTETLGAGAEPCRVPRTVKQVGLTEDCLIPTDQQAQGGSHADIHAIAQLDRPGNSRGQGRAQARASCPRSRQESGR